MEACSKNGLQLSACDVVMPAVRDGHRERRLGVVGENHMTEIQCNLILPTTITITGGIMEQSINPSILDPRRLALP